MTNQQLINRGIAMRDRLMAKIRDELPTQELIRIYNGDLKKSDIPVIRRLAAIVHIDLNIADLELMEVCQSK